MISSTRTTEAAPFAAAIERFLRTQEGRNRSPQTLRAYRSDLTQLVAWLRADNPLLTDPADVTGDDLNAFLADLGRRGLSGVSRARKLAAIREFYRFLKLSGTVVESPVEGLNTPKREKRGRSYLTPEEYNRLLVAAGGHPRDFCILTLFLQTGIRISELCALRLDDIDLAASTLHVRVGKGMASRTIELEKKALRSLKTWLSLREASPYDHLFLNRDGEPLKEWGVRDLLEKYRTQAGITKKVTPHSLRHTFASAKAQSGVSPFQLKEWLGHARLDTTSIYVHMARQNAKKVMDATSL
ncbi:MAG: tyrosine-type recombinase/integrase [Chloroflexota bacterium]|nr:tyrosine-type recombinase/integrase [Chloroflexota bacterium]